MNDTQTVPVDTISPNPPEDPFSQGMEDIELSAVDTNEADDMDGFDDESNTPDDLSESDSNSLPDSANNTNAPNSYVPDTQSIHQQLSHSVAVSAYNAAQNAFHNAIASGAPPQLTQELRRKADTAEFMVTFPDAAKNPLSIPPEVWNDVRNGMSLTSAYSRFAVAQARTQQHADHQKYLAAAQDLKNSHRSTGSMLSSGSNLVNNDPFLQGWNSG